MQELGRLKVVNFEGEQFAFSLNKEVTNSYPNLNTIKNYLSRYGDLAWDSSKITFTSGLGFFEWRGDFSIAKSGDIKAGSLVKEFERNLFGSNYGHIIIDLIEYDASAESGAFFSLTVPNEIRDVLEAENTGFGYAEQSALQGDINPGFNFIFSTKYDSNKFDYKSSGGASDDVLKGYSGDNFGADLLDGGDGDDDLTGYRGADFLNGGAGNDILRAGNGRDILSGGNGTDVFYGGFGLNTFENELDGEIDQLYFRSDQWAENWLYGSAGNSPNGEKADKIEMLDEFDQIYIQGVSTSQLSYGSVDHNSNLGETLSGIGIYASGVLEAVYVGDNLSQSQIEAMTRGIL